MTAIILKDLNIALPIGTTAVLIALAVVLVVFGVLSFILVYHWREYAINTAKVSTAIRTYFTVALPLLAISCISVVLYITSI